MANETAKILNPNEKVIWEGQPQFGPYAVSAFDSAFFGIIWSAFLAPFVWLSFTQKAPWFTFLFLAPFVLVGLYLLIIGPLLDLISYKYNWYTMTDKRVILQRGLVARDFKYIDYDKISSATV